MDMYEKYKSPFGYQVGDNGIDSYGVDHRNFSLRDEIEYQTARDNRESQMMQMYNQQGITDNYPQYTTNFWGDAGNNYGFGSSNITDAISAHPAMNTAPVPIMQTPSMQLQRGVFEQFGDNLGNIVRKIGIDKLTENLYNLGYDATERLTYPQNNAQNYENKSSLARAQAEAQRLTPIKVSDINKHQYVSCVGAFDGPISAGATAAAGLYKEGADLYKKWNNPQYGSNWQILQDSFKDLRNDALGISRGWSANDINDCNYLLPPNARRR